jgi:hypothetical protein
MSEQSSGMHAYLNWTKERMDEMNATLASLEAKTSVVKANAKENADELVAELKRRRDEFRTSVDRHTQAAELARERAKTQLETLWHEFETQLEAYFNRVGKQIEQQQATFHEVAAAQRKAWHEAADRFHTEAGKVATARRADIDAAVKQMKASAAKAEERLQKLREAGGQSWAALSAALCESRNAFDRANQEAWDAFKRAAPPS